MRVYTAHLHEGRAPVLVREGFSFGAFFFGPLWLGFAGAFIPAALVLAVQLAAGLLLQDWVRVAVEFAIAVMLGVSGRDLIRWSLRLHGFRLAHILAAHDFDSALARLLALRPDIAGTFE